MSSTAGRQMGRSRSVRASPHEIWKIVEDYDSDTYRAVYTATFPEVVYVLDAFVKKSKSGSKTPQADKDRVRERFKAAQRDYVRSPRVCLTRGRPECRHRPTGVCDVHVCGAREHRHGPSSNGPLTTRRRSVGRTRLVE
jgi:phage-related protein